MGLIPDIPKIVSGFFNGDDTETHPNPGSSADSQGAFFRKRVFEGMGGGLSGDTDGDGILSIQEMQALQSLSETNIGTISPKLWSVLKYYGKVVKYKGTNWGGDGTGTYYYVNDFGIIRKMIDKNGTGCDETTQYTTDSSITDDEFNLLLTNGMGNFKNGEPINVMPASTQCGIDGKFIEEDGENGWIEPTTGLYRKFAGGIAAADESCRALIGTTAVSGVTPSDYMGAGTGEVYSSSTPCTFPTHIGERSIAQWNTAVANEISSSAKYTSLMAEYKVVRKQYTDFLKTHGVNIKVPEIIPHLSQYYGKHVAVYDENSADNDNSDRYYISPFGFPRKWEGVDGGKWNGYGSAWINRPGSCKGGTMDVVNHISQAHLDELIAKANTITGGNMAPMGMNEPCNVSGKFITATPSGNTAWVDILGFRHDFDGAAGVTCTGGDVETARVTDTEFNAIQAKDSYPTGTDCGVSGMTGEVFTQFISIQSNLIAKGAEALATIKDLTDTGGQVRDQTVTQQNALETEVGELASQQGQIEANQANRINATGRFETGEEQTTYTFRMYVVWMIVALLVMAIAIHAMVSGENTIFVYGVLGLCAVIIIYYAIVRGMRG